MKDIIVRLASMKLAELKFDFEYFLYDEDILEEEEKLNMLGVYFVGTNKKKRVSLKEFKEYVLNMKKYFNSFTDLKVNRITNYYSFKRKSLVIRLHITSKDLGDYTVGIRLFQPSELKKGVFIKLLKSSNIIEKNNPRESPFLKTAQLKFDMVVESRSEDKEGWIGDELISTISFVDEPLHKLNSIIKKVLTGSQPGVKTPTAIQKKPVAVDSQKDSRNNYIQYTIKDSVSKHSPFKPSEYLVVFIRAKSLRDIELLQTILEAGFSLTKKSNRGALEDLSAFNRHNPWSK